MSFPIVVTYLNINNTLLRYIKAHFLTPSHCKRNDRKRYKLHVLPYHLYYIIEKLQFENCFFIFFLVFPNDVHLQKNCDLFSEKFSDVNTQLICEIFSLIIIFHSIILIAESLHNLIKQNQKPYLKNTKIINLK